MQFQKQVYVVVLVVLPVCLAFPMVAQCGLLDSAYPMLAKNPQHTGYTDRVGPILEPTVLWQRVFSTAGHVTVPPVIDNQGNLFVTFLDRVYYPCVVSLDQNGNEIWRRPQNTLTKWTRAELSVPALTDDGRLIYGSKDTNLYCLNQSDGSLFWAHQNSGLTWLSSPAVDSQGNIYVGGTHDIAFLKLEPVNGNVIWEYVIPGGEGRGSSPALSLDQTTVYFGTKNRGAELCALDSSDGSLKWAFSPPVPISFEWSSPTVGPDGTIFQLENTEGVFYSISDNGNSFSVNWEYQLDMEGDAPRTSALVDQDAIYVSTFDGTNSAIVALDCDGSLKWQRTFPINCIETPVSTSEAIYIAAGENLFCLNRVDGSTIWHKQCSLGINDISLSDRGILYASTGDTPSVMAFKGPLSARIDIDPDTINIESKEKWVTAYITLPRNFGLEEVKIESIAITGPDGLTSDSDYLQRSDVSGFPPVIGDRDGDDIPDMEVKFDRQILNQELCLGNVGITIELVLLDGTKFVGTDHIQVIQD
jgi:outer membrane protein assembly factor BamB